jgi:hypothetical protein
MPRAHSEPAACARGKRRVLLETSAHSLPTAWTPTLPVGFFSRFAALHHVRHSAMRLGCVRGAHGGFPAAPAPVPCRRGRGASLGRAARRGVSTWRFLFDAPGPSFRAGVSARVDAPHVRYCDERETATTCVQRTLRSSIDSMRPRYSHATCSTCQIIQLRSVRVHSIRYCPIRIRRTEDADTCSMQNSPPLSKSARVAATVIDSQRTFRHAEVGTARVPP